MSNQEELTLKLRAVREGMAEAIAEVKALEAEVAKGQKTTVGASDDTDKLSGSHRELSRQLNVSRGALGGVVVGLSTAAGASTTFSGALQTILSNLTPIGIALSVVAVGIKLYTDETNKAIDAAIKLSEVQAHPQGYARDAYIQTQAIKDQIAAMEEKRKKVAADLVDAQRLAAVPKLSILPDDGRETYAQGRVKDLQAELNQLAVDIRGLNNLDIFSSAQANQVVTFIEQTDSAADAMDRLAAATAAANFQRIQLLAGKKDSGADRMTGGLLDSTAGEVGTSLVGLYVTSSQGKQTISDQATRDAKAYADAMAAELKAQHQHLLGIVDSMLQVSEVTSQDLKDTAAGKYKDKPDENLRRLRLYPEIDSSIFKMLPAQIQGELRDAFAQGGGAYKLKIDDLIQKGEDFSDPRLWDVAGMVAGLKQAVATEQNKAKLAEMIVSQSGLDKNNATVQAQVGKLTGQDQLGIGGMLDGAKQMLDKFKPSANLMNAINADKEAIINSGKTMGNFIVEGLRSQIEDAVGDISTAFMRNLTNALDGRYVKQAKVYGVTP